MTTTPFELDYAAQREIANLLVSPYMPEAAAENILQLCRGNEGVLGAVALLCMGRGHIELAELLRERGANPFTQNPCGELGVVSGLYPGGDNVDGLTVPLLLSNWSYYDIHVAGAGKASMTQGQAQVGGRMEVFEHVIKHPDRWPVDVNAIFRGQSALVVALGRNNSYDRRDKSVAKKEMYMVSGKHSLEFAEMLLQHGADINLPGTRWSALAACIPDNEGNPHANLDRFQWALSQGADPMHMPHASWARAISEDASVSYGKNGPGPRAMALDGLGVPLVSPTDTPAATSPLVQAVRRQATWAVDRMVASEGFDARWRDPENGDTLLTTFNRSKKFTVALLERLPRQHLADVVNEATQVPALHMAVKSLNPEMVKLVLDLGADPNARNKRGKTALEASRMMTDRKRDTFEAIASLITNAGGTIEGNASLLRAAKVTAVDTIEDLLSQGADVYARDAKGRMAAQLVLTGPALTAAGLFDAERGLRHTQALEVFVRHGFDVNTAVDGEGGTLLHYAVQRCSAQAVKFLIEQGADPNAVDAIGRTPLHMWDQQWNMRYYKKHPKKLFELALYLVESGGDPHMINAKGIACFDEVGQHIPGFPQSVSQFLMERNTEPAAAPQARKPRRI